MILGFFVVICRASRICSRCLIFFAIIVVFSTRIFQNLDLGIEWVLKSLRCIVCVHIYIYITWCKKTKKYAINKAFIK